MAKKSVPIRRIVLDILKPIDPSIVEFAKSIGAVKGVDGVNMVVYEMDRKTETVKVTIEGRNLDFEKIRKVIEELGGVVHSIDQVAVGKRIVEEIRTPQDRV